MKNSAVLALLVEQHKHLPGPVVITNVESVSIATDLSETHCTTNYEFTYQYAQGHLVEKRTLYIKRVESRLTFCEHCVKNVDVEENHFNIAGICHAYVTQN